MASWVQQYVNAGTFLGAGGSRLGELGGGPVSPGPSKTQPLPDRIGDLFLNYSCGGCGCGCGAPMPPGNGSEGVDDVFLCVNWLPDTDPH